MKLACITGASSGIGREFAKQLSSRGFDLILISRNTIALEELKKELNTNVEIIPCDLSDLDSVIELSHRLSTYKIHLFINNAGFGDLGVFDETDLNKDLDMIHVNIRALHILTKSVLKDMKAHDQGYILNVASSAGLLPGGPFMATYYATKSYVVSLTSAISEELKESKSKVHISALCPGPVDTNFNNTAGVSFSLDGISPEACVKSALKGMSKGKLIIIPTNYMKAAVSFSDKLPRMKALKLIAHQQKKKGN